MRVLDLKLQAFGPFKNKEHIEFDNFGKEGIFLISGPTGSGKTSIFDAISYALFGTSSSGERDESMLRYTAANPEDETFVELVFEYKNSKYKIRRTPRYMRPKKSGQGLTDMNTKTAKIDMEDGRQITGLTDVDEFIHNLLGINKDQFNQIAMLAQGNFMKFLKASSSEKMVLFRDIFSTQNFQKLENDISFKLKEKRAQFGSLNTSKEEIISNFIVPEDHAESFEEEKARGLDYLIPFIEKINQDLEVRINKLDKSIEKETLILDEKKLVFNKVNSYFEIQKKIQENQKKLDQLTESYLDLKNQYQGLDKKEEDLIKLNKKKTKLEDEKNKFNRLLEIIDQIKDNQKDLDQKEKSLDSLVKDLEKISQEIKDIDSYTKENQGVKEEKIKKENTLYNLRSKEKELKDLENLQDNIKLVLRGKKEEVLVYEDLKNSFKKAQEEFTSLQDLYFESQAGILAKELKENEPCPVCGSLDHPNLANLPDHMPSKEDLDIKQKDLENQRKKKESSQNKILKLDLSLTNFQENLDKTLKKLGIKEEDFEKQANDLFREIKDLEERIKELEIIEKQIDQKTKLREGLISKEKEENAKREDLLKTISSLEERIKNLIQRKDEEAAILKGKDLEKIMSQIKENQAKIQELDKYIKDTRSNFQEANNSYIKTNQTIEDLKASLDDKYKLDIKEIEEEISALYQKIKDQRKDFIADKSKLDTNLNQLKKLRKLKDQIIDKEREVSNYNELSNVLKGNIKGLPNIRFESFVQGKYFDQILIASNKRFYDMTQGKFSLRRKTEADNKVEQTGLDIEVLDHHNKTSRDVNTLSGGESFQASLSLALGLSDVVQMNAGGIQLDSMFVDEGFGTLDSETLSKLMSTLTKISSSNKLIGIISHVNMLKEQIDKQIIVEKTREGYSKIQKQIY